jgi:type II secretory pathway component PulL
MEQLGLDPSITKLKDFNQDPFSLAALQDDRPLLNFRKGEFVQKGILERIVWPISISALCLFAWLISMTWSNLHQAKLVEKGSAQLRQEQKDIWKALFPNKRPPQSRMASQMQGLYGNMTGEGDSHGNEERASVLQTLGLLFTHISPDEDVLIEKAILDKSINLSGVCNNTNSIAQLTEKFKGQTKFKEPSVDTNNKGRNPDYPITFKFSTEYLGAAKP